MPRGYRCIVLAAFGWLILAAAPQPREEAKGDQSRAERATEQHLANIAAAIEKANKPPQPDTGCEPGHDNRQSDLCAQWKAADAAADSAFWTYATFCLGIAGTVIGAFTLAAAGFAAWYARRAAIETERSANAAEETVAETVRIGEAQTRAYLSVTGVAGQVYDDGLLFKIVVKNSGQSPALEVVRIVHVVAGDGSMIEGGKAQECAVAAGAEQTLPYWYFREAGAHDWTGIVVHAVVAYRDVHGALNTISETFAGAPSQWTSDEFTDLTEGRHVASYLDQAKE